MKIESTVDYPERFLRRMVMWCCRELGADPKTIRRIRFRNRSGRTSGHCYPGSGDLCISVKWCGENEKPDVPHTARKVWGIIERDGKLQAGWGHLYEPRFPHNIPHQIDRMVQVTAHEIFHRQAYVEGIRSRGNGGHHGPKQRGSSEQQTKWHDRKVLEAFQAKREALLAAWTQGLLPEAKPEPEPDPVPTPDPVPDPVKPVVADFVQKRAAKAEAKLAEWERRAKMARRKVQEYRRKVRYYARKGLAASPGK